MITSTSDEERVYEPQQTIHEPKAAKSTRVLLVEDEPLTSEVFARALTRAGHVVDIAKDGLQALRHLREHTPSLVVLDMSLPTLSGAAVVRELRASGCLEVPIVVVSGSEQRQCSLTDAQLAPGVWLTKPVKPRQLVEIVRGMIQSGPDEFSSD